MIRRWIRHKKRSSNLFAGIVLISITASNLLGILLFQSTTNPPIFDSKPSNRRNSKAEKSNAGLLPGAYQTFPAVTTRTATGAPEIIDGTKFFFNTTGGGYLDSRKQYRMHDFVVNGDEWENATNKYSSVCLATQTSIERLYLLLEVAGSWTGPISVAIFVPGMDALLAQDYIVFLRVCSSNIRKHASFHFAYPVAMLPESDLGRSHLKEFRCQFARGVLEKLLERRKSGGYSSKQLLYPQNLLRNLARRGCQTEYHFLTDVDIVPKPGLAEDLTGFLEGPKPCSKCVFVVPTYETKETQPIPRNKRELLELVKGRKAQPFHYTVFIHNQYASNHSVWEKLADQSKLQAAYKVTNYEFFYEPFYVAGSGVPWHDERFIGYGFTRNTQVFETYMAGYEFWVLNPAFAVHRGIQAKRSRTQWRERQNIKNRKLFVQFKKEILEKYKKQPASH